MLFKITSTKYMAGHTDLIGGCLSYSTAELGHKLQNTQLLMGTAMVNEHITNEEHDNALTLSPLPLLPPSLPPVSNGCISAASEPQDPGAEDGATL